jgi:hypothetical protein
MPSNTPNLDLYKKDPATDGNDTFNITTMLNENWDKIDEAVAGKVEKAGDTMPGPLTKNLAAPGAGHVAVLDVFQIASGNKFRRAIDENGNLLLQRWTGAVWTTVHKINLAGGVEYLENVNFTQGIIMVDNLSQKWHFGIENGRVYYEEVL